jgi:hypothetical protein
MNQRMKTMKTHLTLAGLALVAATSTFALLASSAPAAAADPVCQFGFQTDEKKSWLLKCKKTVPLLQKGVALTEAGNANCNTNSYWNFGPAVTAEHIRRNTMVTVRYTCGHVEG